MSHPYPTRGSVPADVDERARRLADALLARPATLAALITAAASTALPVHEIAYSAALFASAMAARATQLPDAQGSFTCPRCGARSHHPDDVANGYCGRCHWWTGDPILGEHQPTSAVLPAPPADWLAEFSHSRAAAGLGWQHGYVAGWAAAHHLPLTSQQRTEHVIRGSLPQPPAVEEGT